MIAKALRQIAALLGLALIPAFVSGAIQLQPRTGLHAAQITPAEVLSAREQIVWVDARSAADFDAGHVADAISLTVEDWDRAIPPFLDAWHPQKLVVVYADSTSAAEPVAARLRDELQMKNVRVLKGSWQRWKAK